MNPEKVTFYVYAETADEIRALEKELHDIVVKQYNAGVIVTADKLTRILKGIANNVFISKFLK